MTDSDLDALARRYFDLWQSQLAGLAADRDLSGSLARLMAAANAQIDAALGGRNAGTPPPAAGAAPAAAASGDSTVDGRELRERLAFLERRVGELERQLAAGAAVRPARKPRVAQKPRAVRKPKPTDG